MGLGRLRDHRNRNPHTKGNQRRRSKRAYLPLSERQQRREYGEAMGGDGSRFWQTQGDQWEFEVGPNGYTGRYRAQGGRMADGTHPVYGQTG